MVRERLVEHRKKEKASYGGLFDKGHAMYNDKEVRVHPPQTVKSVHRRRLFVEILSQRICRYF